MTWILDILLQVLPWVLHWTHENSNVWSSVVLKRSLEHHLQGIAKTSQSDVETWKDFNLEALRGLLEDLVDASGSALSVLLTLLKKTQNETSSGKKGIQNCDTDFHQSLPNPINGCCLCWHEEGSTSICNLVQFIVITTATTRKAFLAACVLYLHGDRFKPIWILLTLQEQQQVIQQLLWRSCCEPSNFT